VRHRTSTDPIKSALFGVLVWISAGLSFAQQTSQNTESGTPQMTPEVPPRASGAPVEIDGRPILMVYSSVAGIVPEERAGNIQQRILRIANRKRYSLTPFMPKTVARGQRFGLATR